MKACYSQREGEREVFVVCYVHSDTLHLHSTDVVMIYSNNSFLLEKSADILTDQKALQDCQYAESGYVSRNALN